MSVQRVILESQRTCQSHRKPNGVEHIAIGVYSQQHIGHDDFVEVALLLIREKQIRFPDFGRIRQHQVFDASFAIIEFKPVIVPHLAKRDLAGIFLLA